ncbi:DNA repair protein RadC [candidate division KSB1 bacterium]|nr:DNA repair protein RadC [candidate division KSB1 bacterium]
MSRYDSRISDWPEADRPRERLMKIGAENLSDAELLAIILRTGTRKTTAIDLARQLLKKFENFRGIDRKSVPELCEIAGVGQTKAVMLKAALEIGKRFSLERGDDAPKISSSEEIYEMLRLHLRDLDREVFKIILLTTRNQIILEKTLFEGSIAESLVSPREIIKESLNYGAAGIIFVHNHPSGDPAPSSEDKKLTSRLKMACEVIGIRVLDHLIIGKDTYYSFADAGALSK